MLHLLRRPPPAERCSSSRRGRSAPLAGCSTRPARRGWEQLELAPLGRVTRTRCWPAWPTPAVRERVVREGRGNPLFLRELARVADRADGALPASLVAAIALEVSALGAVPRALIDGAAVAGDPFDPELAAAAADLDAATRCAPSTSSSPPTSCAGDDRRDVPRRWG